MSLSPSYKRISRGLGKENLLVPFDFNTQEFINKHPNEDYYESIYSYNEDHKVIYQKEKTFSALPKENIVTNRIIFDLDSEIDPSKAKDDAKSLFNKLKNDGLNDNQIQLSYSGSKGFHVELFTTEYFKRSQLEAIVEHYGKDLSTVDYKIVDENRIIRVPLTKNQKTGLYKIPLSFQDLDKSIDDIKFMAKTIKSEYYTLLNSYESVVPPKKFHSLKKVEIERVKTEAVLNDRPDFSRKPKHLSSAKFALLEGFIPPGKSNHAYMILASTFKSLGYSKDNTYSLLKSADRARSERYNVPRKSKDELWKNVINQVYSPFWNGGTYGEKDDTLLKEIRETYKIIEGPTKEKQLVSLNDVIGGFEDFATNIDKNTIKMGLEDLDSQVRLTTNMLVSLLGAPGASKTSFSFRFLNYINSINEHAVMFSLDMSSFLVFQRLIQKHTGKTSDEIFEIYKNGNEKEKKRFNDILNKEYQNVKFCFEAGMTCDDIRERMLTLSEQGIKPKVIVIDYLECITTGITDSTASKAFVALKLKDIANEFNTCVLLLTQPVKSAGDPRYPLNSYSAIKGSGVIAEQSSIVLTVHRPGFSPDNPENDKFVSITVVKNRMGQLGQFDYSWHGLTGEVGYLNDDEREDLKQIRERFTQQEKNSM